MADVTSSTLILGVGNPLMGDDALGVIVAQHLQQRADLPPGVDVVDGGTEGIGLIPLMESYRRVIVVDAVLMGLPAGTIRRFTWQDVQLNGADMPLSLHQSDLTGALRLAETLGCLPAQVVFYGVQPHNTAWDQPLSSAVERALPLLIKALLDEVTEDAEENSDN